MWGQRRNKNQIENTNHTQHESAKWLYTTQSEDKQPKITYRKPQILANLWHTAPLTAYNDKLKLTLGLYSVSSSSTLFETAVREKHSLRSSYILTTWHFMQEALQFTKPSEIQTATATLYWFNRFPFMHVKIRRNNLIQLTESSSHWPQWRTELHTAYSPSCTASRRW